MENAVENGRILSRRSFLKAVGIGAFSTLVAACEDSTAVEGIPLTNKQTTVLPTAEVKSIPLSTATLSPTFAPAVSEPARVKPTTSPEKKTMIKEEEIKAFYLRGEIQNATGERTIKLVGASWTKEDTQLLQKRLEWIRVNDPVLYDHIFEFDGFKKGNLAIGDIGGSCRGALCSWVSEAGNVLMTIPNPQKIFIWGDERQSNLISVVALWHEWGRIVADHPSLADEYSLFQGISRSFSSRGDQFAASLGWLAADRIQERLRLSDDDPTVSTLKNGELTFIGLPSNTDLSYLYNDPAVLSTGLTKN